MFLIMSDIFTLDKFMDFSEKINIDELYEKKKQVDMKQLELFQKILNRVHVRIKTTARLYPDVPYCWYVVPEMILGVAKYCQANCIAYVMDKLQENKFNVRYIHPNTLLIAWNHWVPTYVRNEIKKKTGIVVDELGNKIEQKNDDDDDDVNKEPESLEHGLMNNNKDVKGKPSKNYKSIDSYKPTGNLVYNKDLLNKIEDRFS